MMNMGKMQYRAEPAEYEDFIDYYFYLRTNPRASQEEIRQSLERVGKRYAGHKNFDGHPQIEAMHNANYAKYLECQSIFRSSWKKEEYDRVWEEHLEDVRPLSLVPETTEEVRQLYRQAIQLYDEGEYRRSMMYLDDAERKDTAHNPNIPYMTAVCYQAIYDEGDWPAGYAAARRSLQYAQESERRQYGGRAEARAWALMAFYSDDDQQRRQYCYEQAAKLDPNNPQYAVPAIHTMTDYEQALHSLGNLRAKYPKAQCVKNEYLYMIFKHILTLGSHVSEGKREPEFPPRPSKEQVLLAYSYLPLLDELGEGAALQETDDTVIFMKAPTVNGDIKEMRVIVEKEYARITKPSLFGSLRAKFARK